MPILVTGLMILVSIINEINFFEKILFIYFQTEEKGRRKRGRKISICGCLSHIPGDPGCNPGMCPRPGTKPVTIGL